MHTIVKGSCHSFEASFIRICAIFTLFRLVRRRAATDQHAYLRFGTAVFHRYQILSHKSAIMYRRFRVFTAILGRICSFTLVDSIDFAKKYK